MRRLAAALAILAVLPVAAANGADGLAPGFERNNLGVQVWDVYELQLATSGWIDLNWRTGALSSAFPPVYHFVFYARGAFNDGVLEDREILAHGIEAGLRHEELHVGFPPARYPVAVIPRTATGEGYALFTDAGGLVLAGQVVVPLCPQDPCG